MLQRRVSVLPYLKYELHDLWFCLGGVHIHFDITVLYCILNDGQFCVAEKLKILSCGFCSKDFLGMREFQTHLSKVSTTSTYLGISFIVL